MSNLIKKYPVIDFLEVYDMFFLIFSAKKIQLYGCVVESSEAAIFRLAVLDQKEISELRRPFYFVVEGLLANN